MITSGVYMIKSLSFPERTYIGSAKNLKRRIMRHKHDLRFNIHTNPKLQRHYNKYGGKDLDFWIVEELEFINKKQLFDCEQRYIDEFNPFFNIRKVAGSAKDYVPTQETKDKISKAHSGKVLSTEHCKHISESKMGEKNPNFGKHFTYEHRKKISEALRGNQCAKGHKQTEEHKRKVQENRSSTKGYIPTWETRMKLRNRAIESHAKRKNKLREANMGNKYTLGYKHTEEDKKKISEASKRMWELRRLKKELDDKGRDTERGSEPATENR